MQSLEKGVVKCNFWVCFTAFTSAYPPTETLQDGRTPAIIFSLPDNKSRLVSISANVAANMVSINPSSLLESSTPPKHYPCTSRLQVRIHGRMGLVAQRYIINLGDEQLPVLVRES